MKEKVLVAMSGGVDSSVAACLLKEQGYAAMGVTLKLFDTEEVGMTSEKACCKMSDIEDARSVADNLEMPYYVFDFSGSFREEVIDRFIAAYENGMTPNPCIDCNHYIKFKKLFEEGEKMQQQYVATGHYAQVEYDVVSGRYLLKKAVDSHKDQSYVLYTLTQHQLAHVLFPLGSMEKSEAREIAQKYNLINAQKKDSQDICFAPDGDYAGFIKRTTGREYLPGDFVDQKGKVLGRHKGIIRYTVGQRKGLGLALPQPMYVMRKDLEKNQVVLGHNEDLFTKSFDMYDVNWIACQVPASPLQLSAKIRYSQKEYSARVVATSETEVHVEFSEPQRAITSGQAAVLYDGDIVVAGGTIR